MVCAEGNAQAPPKTPIKSDISIFPGFEQFDFFLTALQLRLGQASSNSDNKVYRVGIWTALIKRHQPLFSVKNSLQVDPIPRGGEKGATGAQLHFH